jgi:hypothetical protein
VRWEKNVVPFQRGAWLRLYGVPLHAWNESFFKLCTLDCGRFLRSDSCSVERDRFDYARILIATSNLEIINSSESVLVDGVMVTIKIVEEWGFNIGDDACLYEEGEGSDGEQAQQEDCRVEQDVDVNADALVDKIVQELVESEGNHKLIDDIELQAGSNFNSRKLDSNPSQKTHDSREYVESAATNVQPALSNPLAAESQEDPVAVQQHNGMKINIESSAEVNTCSKFQQRRSKSCPPRSDRSLVSGPWSLKWLHAKHYSDVRAVSSSAKDVQQRDRFKSGRYQAQRRKKVDGVMRHNVHSLKKVARLPNKDRAAVMKYLKKKNGCKHQGSTNLKKAVTRISKDLSDGSSSSSSVNNDLKHWVVLHGSEKVVREDVVNLGDTIGVQLSGCSNMFGVLAKKGKGKKKGTDVGEGVVRGSVEGVE